MINETPGNKYNKSSDREDGTNGLVRAYKSDTPGETPDAPFNALDKRYEVGNMYDNNKMPEPFHTQVEKEKGKEK